MRSWLCLAPTLLLAAPGPARELSTAEFANLFIERQPVRIRVGEGGPATLILRDIDGREIARQEAPAAGEVDFGDLPPGYWEVVCGDQVLPLVVVIDPENRVMGVDGRPLASRLGTDVAMSWLVRSDDHEAVAETLRLCGVRQVRERLSWGEVEKEAGQQNWEGRYATSLMAYHRRAIEVYDIFHGVPGWSRADRDGKAACDDLRVIHDFARSLAERWRGIIAAWEVWNEPDISFFSHPSSEMAAFQKAAFLGFREIPDGPIVLGPSMAHGVSAFSDGLFDNGIADYIDVWNYHIYADPSAYPGRAADWRASLLAHGVNKPLWVTEAGDRVPGPEGVLTPESRRHQAAFVGRAFAQAMASGVDRHYWFVYPFYREKEIGWGFFGPGQDYPFPGLAAFSTATWAFGAGDYLGQVPNLPDEARAFAVRRGDGSAALVVWREADAPAPVTLPLDWSQVTEARNYLGTPWPGRPGPVTVSIGRAPVYLLLPEAALAERLERPAPPPVAAPRPAPGLPQVVVRVQVAAEPMKDADAYRARASQPVDATVQVYNFGAEPLAATLRLTGEHLAFDHETTPLILPVGERFEFPVQVTLTASERAVLRAVVEQDGQISAPAVVPLVVDANELPAVAEQSLNLDAPDRWQRNIAGHGTLQILPGSEGGVRFEIAFEGAGDPWAYPQALMTPPLDASAWQGVRFEYRTDHAEVGVVRFMAVEADGPSYMTAAGFPGSTGWRQVTVPFSSLTPMGTLPPGHGRLLKTDRLRTLRVGANLKPASITLEVRNLRLVRWSEG